MPPTVQPRVVVADDSALMRRIVTNLLTRGGVKVVGSARDGDEALALCERERPDAMTLDLAMPGMGGIEVLRALRARGKQFPVVVVSAFSPAQGARAVDALAEGAFDLVPKPSGNDDVDTFGQTLLAKVMLAVQQRNGHKAGAVIERVAPRPVRKRTGLPRVLMIATSTGGPRALAALLPKLPAPLGAGTLMVQHMPPGFTASLAARLDRSSELNVIEAAGGEKLDPRRALLAPGGWHLRLSDDGRTRLSDDPALGGLRPRADLLIEDAARVYGDRLVLVVLTGMGQDGLRGAREVRKRGGRILAESQETCTVYGMPRAIVEAKLADDVVPLERMAAMIAAEVA
jgi:two-component system, chemotaxis family, protein-glutamate methylesterase/glutaminase